MFQINGTLSLLSIDIQRYTKTLDATMQVQMRQAARAWLRAVIPKIPVYTGTARGTFKPLGSFLRVAIPIAPVAPIRRKISAEPTTFEFTKTGFVYTFEYDVKLFYITLNNFYDMSAHIPLINPTPWKAFEAGDKAWDKYVAEEMPKRFPKPEDFFTSKDVLIY